LAIELRSGRSKGAELEKLPRARSRRRKEAEPCEKQSCEPPPHVGGYGLAGFFQSAWGPAQLPAADDMAMQMRHGLTGIGSIVEHQAVAGFR